MRVLYVEDNPTNVFLVKRVAKVGQHEIINFVDGSEALRKYNDIAPDLVLMDVQLSGELSGLDVVRQLRARGIDVPIIAVTAYAMVGDKERCIEAGCTDYLAKPLPVPRLVEIFQEYSDATEAAKAKSEPTSPEATVAAPAEDKSEPKATSANATEAEDDEVQSIQATDSDAEKSDNATATSASDARATADAPTATDEKSSSTPTTTTVQSTNTAKNDVTTKDETITATVDSTDENKDKEEAETTLTTTVGEEKKGH